MSFYRDADEQAEQAQIRFEQDQAQSAEAEAEASRAAEQASEHEEAEYWKRVEAECAETDDESVWARMDDADACTCHRGPATDGPDDSCPVHGVCFCNVSAIDPGPPDRDCPIHGEKGNS